MCSSWNHRSGQQFDGKSSITGSMYHILMTRISNECYLWWSNLCQEARPRNLSKSPISCKRWICVGFGLQIDVFENYIDSFRQENKSWTCSMSFFWLHDISLLFPVSCVWGVSVEIPLRSWNLSLRQRGLSFAIPPNMLQPCIAIAMQAHRAFNFFSGARFSSSAYASIHRNHGCQKIFFSW